jgi:outer membrane protein OmpA-like peptidoglycan-associated protein
MKTKYICKLITVCCFCILSFTAKSQQVNTLYFLENAPVRHYLNPAFQPLSNFYFGLPVLGYMQIGVNNNSFALKDFIYNNGGQTVTFLHPAFGSIDNFYNNIRPSTNLSIDLQLNLLDFGFRTGAAYWSFGLTEKINAGIYLPKDMFKLILYGTPDINHNTFDFKGLGTDVSMYTEAALGYSREINEQWSFGGKAKLLLGQANVSMNNNINLTAGIDQWTLSGEGVVNAALPLPIDLIDKDDDGMPDSVYTPASRKNWIQDNLKSLLKPAGLGGGIDLGVTYKPIEALTLSLAVTDLGFINWRSNVNNIHYRLKSKFAFDGIHITGDSEFDTDAINNMLDSIGNSLKDKANVYASKDAYTTYTTAKLNLGAEYGFFDNKISLGVLSRTMSYKSKIYEELTGALNLRPASWINASVSYSVLNGRSSIGAGLGLRVGWFNWFIASDFIPVEYTKGLPVSDNGSFKVPVPYNTKGFNLTTGFNLTIGNRRDKDRDGVVDRKDKCPDTDIKYLSSLYPGKKKKELVDKQGCPVDSDGDGVPDYLDKCPGTPAEAIGLVDSIGCPLDTDNDNVPDYLDKCPGTPAEAIGLVDSIGCPLDSDGDGVFDYLDKCPDTPTEAFGLIDSIGCPLDSDGDEVPDYLDKCPDTPKEAIGFVDENGCPKDSDGDGVLDYLDKCPDTPESDVNFVDENGCSKDTDGDGVPDSKDKCPDTPKEAAGFVDENGCPKDSDGDGVLDYLDKCPDTPKEAAGFVDENGCPKDSDGDGIPDYLDKCPGTSKEAIGFVDENGCPKDTDGDGIPDYLDRCPTIVGVASNNGCPELKREIRQLFQKALQGIQFDTGKSTIKKISYTILDQIAKVLEENPTYKVEIQGHTDNVGKEDMNMKLSEDRAASVRQYLIDKGVGEGRITSKGFGPTVPVASNKTAAGKAKNRRVEFVVSFEEVHYETVNP